MLVSFMDWSKHVSWFGLLAGIAICVADAQFVSHRPDGWKRRIRERTDECMSSGRTGERWRQLFFSFFLSHCQEVTSSLAIWRECHATLPFPSLYRRRWSFMFLCGAVAGKQFFPSWLTSAMVATGRHPSGDNQIRQIILSDPLHAFIRRARRRTKVSRDSSLRMSTIILPQCSADLFAERTVATPTSFSCEGRICESFAALSTVFQTTVDFDCIDLKVWLPVKPPPFQQPPPLPNYLSHLAIR